MKTKRHTLPLAKSRERAPSQPPLRQLRRRGTHRLIQSKYFAGGESVLARLTSDGGQLADAFDIEGATNDRLCSEHQLLPGIGAHELVCGIPYSSVVNAAFTHAHPLGSRFNGPDRGAWYAAFDLRTSQAEVIFHNAVALAEVGRLEDEVTYDDYLADFACGFHDLRDDPKFAPCLNPDSYMESQTLAESLLALGSLGVVYPSARRPMGTCIACFRPALVTNVQKGATYRFTWSGTSTPRIEELR